MSNVFLTALGCRLNEAELQRWAQEYQQIGYQLVQRSEDAQLMIINTCAVTGEAARKSRQLIRKQHRTNPSAKLVVTGCYASLEEEQANELLGVDLVVPNTEKEQLVAKTQQVLELPTMPTMATEPGEPALFARNKERAFIKVQDGCRYRCTFCIVTVARGDERSRTPESIIDEVNKHVAEGVQEIVVAGVHVGGYGSDLDTDLFTLVRRILDETEVPRIRFASVEPWDLPEDFFTLFENPRVMPHMHLPLQSGADSVLRRMARRCKTEAFKKLVTEARENIPNFNVTTDIIVGFPGETDEEFDASMAYIEELGFGHIHIFSYSPREGTKAARLSGHLNNDVKKSRSQRLHALAANQKQSLMQQQVGQSVDVLWEGNPQPQENGLMRYVGHTPNYHRVFIDVPASYNPANQILLTQLVEVNDAANMLRGEADLNQINKMGAPIAVNVSAH
ncbi:tRNA (N(6)-L-threonylcarbamoyladenosine(37)-C(2))-methylthiotransferase MtaB [Pleionea sp. CnH1-48]|uniref:tRNA (N(6)-L-threonylcarbamoyladenosine(37)-C(2))- methylthiotransferase MtaB n=1 Tax=Pleionea sp. CnH1-48 TaxID=2954494 RepID=UPI002096E387|nr:tRNA (N(6)-L-threonylcarbamoyladenosine(37)-C(2))-methylthiotransferase MtaB [Pleionea sp. CnH1-48]MCO7223899.1 tRNA (N(6)-L-threonylcarbamoyladenosine(37)-C(2))-methylthiotransferase MtaB [Pleionea sp. CnH1-48]